jgi:hypothetical protein
MLELPYPVSTQIQALAIFLNMADKLHQFQMAFVAEQDRMLLRISTRDKAELRLWMTRRVVRLLWGALLKMFEAGPEKNTPIVANKREAILQFAHQSAVEQADFKTPFQEAADSYPLGAEGVLVASMQISRRAKGAYTLKLSPKQGKGIAINLDDTLMHSFMEMLIDSSKRAEWDLELRLPVSGPTTSTDVTLPDKLMRH